MKITFFMLLISFQLSGINQVNTWEFEFEKDGIKVYTREVGLSNFKAFKGEMLIDVAAEKLVGFIEQVELFPQWCDQTTAIEIIKEKTDTVFYRYISGTPAMVKNREAYMMNVITKKEKNGEVTIAMQTFNSSTPIPKDFVRMPSSEGGWKIIPVGPNTTRLIFEMHADPGGYIPSWLANHFSINSPYVTLMNLRRIMTEH